MTTVSVAIATYNGRQYIQRQLDSLAAQTYRPAELVVTDDSSTDDTLAIVEGFATTLPFPVRILKNERRLGYRANFMRAASLCQSELIAFCDQDDIWYPEKIARAIASFDDPDVLLSYHNAHIVTDDGTRVGSLDSRAAPQPIVPPLSSRPWWPYALGFTEVFRRSLLPFNDLASCVLNQNPYDQPIAHDQWVYFLASVLGKIAYVDEPLVAHVLHGQNAYGWQTERVGDWMQQLFRDRAEGYQHLARAAESRAVALDSAKIRFEGTWAERAGAGSAYYRTLASVYGQRGVLYNASKFGERVKAYQAIVRMGGYRRRCGFGYGALLGDVVLGVFSIGAVTRSLWR